METYKRRMPVLKLESGACTVYCKIKLLPEEDILSYGLDEVYKIDWDVNGGIDWGCVGIAFSGAIAKLSKMLSSALQGDFLDTFTPDDDENFEIELFKEEDTNECVMLLRLFLDPCYSYDNISLYFDEKDINALLVYCQLFEGKLDKSDKIVQQYYDLGIFQGD
ncbi:hypothetical protein AALT52_07100 [Ligilactobacillus faecis]|uniref:Uncharacterized protein n=1 Tax=Ligilactobacillus faecis TaxID=762833 RepID=A0ABV4DQ99_9LACO